jgi:D-hydroxyproline dehydrogenase subunit gamma
MADRRVDPVARGEKFEIFVNGLPVAAYPGETVAGALIAAGIRTFRRTMETETDRGQFCGMGICYDCLIELDNQLAVRACMTPAAPGMEVRVPEYPDRDA